MPNAMERIQDLVESIHALQPSATEDVLSKLCQVPSFAYVQSGQEATVMSTLEAILKKAEEKVTFQNQYQSLVDTLLEKGIDDEELFCQLHGQLDKTVETLTYKQLVKAIERMNSWGIMNEDTDAPIYVLHEFELHRGYDHYQTYGSLVFTNAEGIEYRGVVSEAWVDFFDQLHLKGQFLADIVKCKHHLVSLTNARAVM
ncbi:hypothetical protein DH09_01215 (plasmid) [Bacillaceae bacterium JMAK1]|nr:hypothetical protein DH09_01215 [Bacillaceae bacterium JMAK1]